MAHIAVTPGSGAFVATYADVNGDSNPGGVAAYLVGATATPVDATHQLPVLATQAGTWTVTGAGGTFPVTAAALPLPAGAATSAKQAALGTAGTASADILTIQGIASMTPVQTSVRDGAGNALTSLAVGSQRAVTVAIVDASGNQVTAFGGSGGTASNFGSAVPATGTAAGYSDGTNLQAARVFDADSGAGTQYVAGVVLRGSASGGSVEIGTGTNPVRTDPTGTTTQPVSGTVTVNALPAGTSTIGAVSLAPATAGGLSTSSTISAASTNATSVKASAGQVFGYSLDNTTGSPVFVKFYDKATAPTVGTDVPIRRMMIPANGGRERTLPNGLQFSAGIAFAVTANAADADTTAVAAGAALINIDYK